MSLKFVRFISIPALIQIMAWRRPGDKLLSEQMMVSSHCFSELTIITKLTYDDNTAIHTCIFPCYIHQYLLQNHGYITTISDKMTYHWSHHVSLSAGLLCWNTARRTLQQWRFYLKMHGKEMSSFYQFLRWNCRSLQTILINVNLFEMEVYQTLRMPNSKIYIIKHWLSSIRLTTWVQTKKLSIIVNNNVISIIYVLKLRTIYSRG